MFGSDGSPIVQYVVIFAVIFTALAAIVFTVRRITGRNLALPGRGGGRGRQPRLGIVDVYELDRARQLILLRRDNVEHLLLVGGPNDVVVERNIQRGQRPLPEAALRSDPATDSLDEPLPDPMVQGGRLPEPPRVLQEMPGRRAEPLFDPGFEMPVVVPPPVPRSSAHPSVTLPLDVALLGGDEPGQDVSAPFMPSPPPPAAPDVVPPPSAREPVTPRRILSRTAPPLVEPRPGPFSERSTDPVPVSGGTETARQAPSLTVPSDRRSVDPAILSDMARQLQAALSRPSSAVISAPPPAAPAFDGVDPVAAAMAAAPPVPVPHPAAPPIAAEPAEAPPQPPPAVDPRPPVLPDVVPPVSPPEPPAAREVPPLDTAAAPPPPLPRPTPVEPAVPPAMPKTAPAFQPPLPAPEPVPPSAPSAAPRAESKASGNPFSVEEIEAEFARLLGRPLDKRS